MALDRAYNEKRGFIRMRIDAPVQVDADGQQFTARCKDLSGSGMLLASDRGLALGTEVNVTIEQEGKNRQPFRATATVVRSDEDPADGHIVGLSILSIQE